MRDGQEIPAWAKEMDASRENLRSALFDSVGSSVHDARLFDAIDRFVTAKIEAMKRERY